MNSYPSRPALGALGRLQMAEGRLSPHSPEGTPTDDLFVVHHYPRPTPGALGKIRLVGPDGSARAGRGRAA